jgi:hypothetical protein
MGVAPGHYRLLYDSWLWRHVIYTFGRLKRDSAILELLPGSSLTIPAALESVGHRGTVVRLDDEVPVRVPETFHFNERVAKGPLCNLSLYLLPYDLILGNHIIDDLLFNSYCTNSDGRQNSYSDPERCRHVWNAMVKSGHVHFCQNKLASEFREIAHAMKRPSALILRHYPSTFALRSHDLLRINAEMATYFSIAKALSANPEWNCFFFDPQDLPIPIGAKYKNSFLVLQKGM